MAEILTRMSGSYEGRIMTSQERLGDYDGIRVYEDNQLKLELRVSRSAIANQPCGLSDINLNEWLWKEALKLLKAIKSEGINKFTTLLITSYDVENAQLKTDWRKLQVNE